MSTEIFSVFERSNVRPALLCDPSTAHGRSRTKQSFKAESDVNNIMKRYIKTGILVDPSLIGTSRKPMYGDFSGGDDFRSVQDRLVKARSVFSFLPASVRAEFGNDPAVMLDFVARPENGERALALGLLDASDLPSKPVIPPDGQSGTGTPVGAPVSPSGAVSGGSGGQG